MSVLATSAIVAGTLGASSAVSGMILKFGKNEYETKISTLEGYANLLEQHLTRLESLKSRIGEFWKDERAADYAITLTNQITTVRFQIDRVRGLKLMYQEISAEMSGADEKVKGLIEAANSALSQLGE